MLLSEHNWRDELKIFYGSLCDVVHVKGEKNSYRKIQPSQMIFGGAYAFFFSSESSSYVWDTFIQAVRYTAMILVFMNPPLLVCLPLYEKFGLNAPLGFFENVQVERLNELLPNNLKAFFNKMKNEYSEIVDLLKYFNSLPDITEEEINRQALEMKPFMKN